MPESTLKHKPRRFLLRTGANGLLLAVSIGLGAVVLEGGARLWQYGSLAGPSPAAETALLRPDPVLGARLVPNTTVVAQKLDYRNVVRVNSHGFRDRERAYEPAPGTYRILVLGDSFIEARQVPFERSLPQLLEARFADRKVEVLNLGVPGYGTAQEYLLLRDEGLKYRPDLVLLAFLPNNDLSDNYEPLEAALYGPDNRRTYGRPYPQWTQDKRGLTFTTPDYERSLASYKADVKALREQEAAKPFYQRTLVYALYQHGRQYARAERKGEVIRFDPNVMFCAFLGGFMDWDGPAGHVAADVSAERVDEAWDITSGLVQEMEELCVSAGSRLAVFLIPGKVQVEPDYQALVQEQFPSLEWDYDKPARMLRDRCKAMGTPFLDLTPDFRAACSNGDRRYYNRFDDAHWSAAGHALAARRLAEFLETEGLVPAASEEKP